MFFGKITLVSSTVLCSMLELECQICVLCVGCKYWVNKRLWPESHSRGLYISVYPGVRPIVERLFKVAQDGESEMENVNYYAILVKC